MKWLKWTGLTFVALLLLLSGFAAWLIHTPAGAQWAANLATTVLGAKLDIAAVHGRIAGPLEVRDLHYRDPSAGVDLHVERAVIDLTMDQLWRRTLHVNNAALAGVSVLLTEPQQPPPPPEKSAPFSLEPPIDIIIERFTAERVHVRRDDATVFELTRGVFAGRWTDADLAVEQLELRAPQGAVTFAGRVAGRQTYEGEGQGSFRWRVGEQTYAGGVQTRADGAAARFTVKLTAPLRATLDATLEQKESAPWRFALKAPRFDPRERLAPGSSIESLAASLNGRGTLQSGTVDGEVLINGAPLHLDPVHFRRGRDTLALDARLRIGDSDGVFEAQSDVQLAEQPWIADVRAEWRDVVIPAQWSGQALHTYGDVSVHGNTATFNAKGALAIGPPERLANVRLAVVGTPKTIELSRFDIVQASGRLAATGRIDLKPSLGWMLQAESEGFDPGAFAAGWQGDLNFTLATQGRLTAEGPSATMRLQDLKGELRGRPLSGAADLMLTPALVPSGTLALKSGRSSLRFEGARGERIDANASVDVSSLNDWLPDSGGRLNGAVRVRGRWPDISIAGDARGADLHASNIRLAALDLDAQVDNPKNPTGEMKLDLTRLSAAGFEFSAVTARASGDPRAHQLEVRAAGEPLAIQLTLQGRRSAEGWDGALNTLVLDIKDAARLALREPARIKLAQGGFDLSRSCLADRQIELCASATAQPDGALQASYSLANAPLALGNALATADLPLVLEGAIGGRGDIRRTPDGELFGEASITSREGRISRRLSEPSDDTPTEPPQLLLAYNDLQLAASLAGSQATARARARFTGQGELDGEVSVRGLDQPESPINARLNARLADLAPFGILAPQLANLHGRADANVRVTGTVQTPKITGAIKAAELAADVPALGLHLKNGRLEAQPAASGDIEFVGGVQSGDGRIEFGGVASPSGAVALNINGDRFLAADIPGARALITPDLRIEREDERVQLSGQVTIPEASVNLQKLPRGERAQAPSSDVVVIDEKTRADEVEQTPVFANVTVIVGEKVELTGFGLQATLGGRLDIVERPGEPTTGSGQIDVAGTYKAYGQDLTIQQGQLLYAATPLDNPRLNIEATRQVEEVTAGLRVRGTAQDPELSVFSDPPMSQANALSYVVAGKPLEEIGSGEGEGDMVQTAARSLGTAAGGLLAKAVGRRLGVDKLSIQDEEAIGGAALTVGQYLSPRLYLSYGVGLFEPGEVATLRYKLSQELHVQAQRGPEDTRAGVEYRVER